MARRTAAELSGTPLSLVYIAGNMAEAETAERILNDMGIDYVVNLEPFMSASVSLTLGQEHVGLFVYVPTTQHRSCREMLERNGLTDTVDLEGSLIMENTDGA